jgi:hypothetical protein
MKIKPTSYTVSFDQPVCIKGALTGGPTPVMASYLCTGEGDAFKREIPGSQWAYLDIILKCRQPNDDKASPPVKVSVVVPNDWDTVLVLALIVKHTREHDTLRFDSPSGRIRDVFDWFVHDANSVRRYLATQDVYKSIKARDEDGKA